MTHLASKDRAFHPTEGVDTVLFPLSLIPTMATFRLVLAALLLAVLSPAQTAVWKALGVTSPPDTRDADFAYDNVRDRLASFGGTTSPQALWEFDGSTWTRRPDGPAGYSQAIAYDSLRRRYVVVVTFPTRMWRRGPSTVQAGRS